MSDKAPSPETGISPAVKKRKITVLATQCCCWPLLGGGS